MNIQSVYEEDTIPNVARELYCEILPIESPTPILTLTENRKKTEAWHGLLKKKPRFFMLINANMWPLSSTFKYHDLLTSISQSMLMKEIQRISVNFMQPAHTMYMKLWTHLKENSRHDVRSPGSWLPTTNCQSLENHHTSLSINCGHVVLYGSYGVIKSWCLN